MTSLFAAESHSVLVKLLQTLSIALQEHNVGVAVELKYGSTHFHLTVTDCLIPDRAVRQSVSIPIEIKSGAELSAAKANLAQVANFTGGLSRDSLERKRLLERRKELLASLSDEDKYVLGIPVQDGQVS